MRPIVNVPEDERATAIGNRHTNLVKIARKVPEISWRTDRQTQRHVDRLQYFATALAGEVKRVMKKNKNRDAEKKQSSHKVCRVSPMRPEESLWWDRVVKEVGFEPQVTELRFYVPLDTK